MNEPTGPSEETRFHQGGYTGITAGEREVRVKIGEGKSLGPFSGRLKFHVVKDEDDERQR